MIVYVLMSGGYDDYPIGVFSSKGLAEKMRFAYHDEGYIQPFSLDENRWPSRKRPYKVDVSEYGAQVHVYKEIPDDFDDRLYPCSVGKDMMFTKVWAANEHDARSIAIARLKSVVERGLWAPTREEWEQKWDQVS